MWDKSQTAYDAWKKNPSAWRREDLRLAIEKEGGKIEGHGVIRWAKAMLK